MYKLRPPEELVILDGCACSWDISAYYDSEIFVMRLNYCTFTFK